MRARGPGRRGQEPPPPSCTCLAAGANTIRGAVVGNTMINVTVSNNKVAPSRRRVGWAKGRRIRRVWLQGGVMRCWSGRQLFHRAAEIVASLAKCTVEDAHEALLGAIYQRMPVPDEVRALPLSVHIQVRGASVAGVVARGSSRHARAWDGCRKLRR